MAVAWISDTAKAVDQAAASFTYTSFAVSGTNPVVVVCVGVGADSSNFSVTSVDPSAGLTCADGGNGVNKGVRVKSLVGGTGVNAMDVEVWVLVAPAGTGTITVTLSGSTSYESIAYLLSGAHQTSPCPTGDAVSGSGTDPVTITPTNLTASDLVVGMGANYQAGDAPVWTVGTERLNNNTGAINVASGYHVGTGAVTVDWNGAVASNTMVAVRVAEEIAVESGTLIGAMSM